MVNAVGVLPLIVILICIALFIVIFVRDERRRMGRPWLVFTLVAMSVTAAAFLITTIGHFIMFPGRIIIAICSGTNPGTGYGY